MKAITINPVYKNIIFNNQDRYLVLRGSGGSGKSRAIAQKIILRMLGEQGHRFLVTRKVKDTLKNSVFEELKTVINDLGVNHLFTCITSPLEIRCRNKNKIIFIGADDPEKMKSLSGITGIWIEEATDFEPNDFDQLDLRLRGTTNHYQQICLSFNPISEQHWLKARFFDNQQPSTTTLSTTYLDNRFLSAEHGARMEQLKLVNENYYRIYALGEWGKITTGAEFYRNWGLNNVASNHYNVDNPIHISFDFNVVPYCTAIVAQIQKQEVGYMLNIINELCLAYPKNNTQSLCNAILDLYPNAPKVFVYGDPAGNSRDTRSIGSDYTIIMNALKPLNPVNKVASYAPRLSYRNIFINLIMAKAVPTINLVVSPFCKMLIKDFEEVTENADGGKLKKRITDKQTGQSYEPIGHTSDAFDYLVCELFKQEFNAIQGKKAGIYAG
jgi:hypothetical protein